MTLKALSALSRVHLFLSGSGKANCLYLSPGAVVRPLHLDMDSEVNRTMQMRPVGWTLISEQIDF